MAGSGKEKKGKREGDLPTETRLAAPETACRAKSQENVKYLQYSLTQRA